MSFKLRITNAKAFLEGQLTLHKIEYAETENEQNLKAMDEFNDVIEVIITLEEYCRKIHKEQTKNN